jgi:transcription elongation GreA/GreB family factor
MSKAPGTDHHGSQLPKDVERRLREELASLRAERDQLRGDSADDHRAADAGDRAEAMRLADDVFRIEDRITEINRLLTVGISRPATSANSAALAEGTRITLRFADGDEETFYASSILDAAPDAPDMEVLGLGSPLAKAIAGKSVGDTISWVTPGGPQKADLVDIR